MARLGRAYPTPPRVATARFPSLVKYDTVGAGASFSNATSASWTHTVGASANALIVSLSLAYFSYQSTPAISGNINGSTTLPLLGSVYWGPLNNWLPWLAVFGLISPPTGSVTINLSFASTGPNVSSYAQSVSYSNVASFGSLTTAANTSFANLHTMTSLIAPGNLAFNTFATNAGSVANITSYNQTTRQNIIFGYQNNSGLILGDAPGGNAPVNFSATTSNNSTAYGGAVLPIFHA